MDDDVDRSLLRLLGRDGRMSFADLARETGLSTSAVHQRVRRLEQRGIITGYQALVDPRLVGLPLTALIDLTPLDPAARSELEQVLRGALGKEPVLHGSVDPELIGGLVVRVGDRVWDGSLSWQIRRLQEQLMERGNHAIQSGRDRFRTDR